ncbi:MAG TPA: azurin [Crocinitomicaceae bacterium]|nr:azurin [Crocinitomicaceae bacterium]
MKKVRISVMFFMLSAGMFTFTSCGGSETPTETTTEQTDPHEAHAHEDATAVTLEIESNDKMQFNLSELNVKAGQEVTLVLKHTGTMAKTAMGHNLVILKAGVDLATFAKEAIAAKDNDYIPVDSQDVIAHTKLIGGGESDQITFTAPEAGEYDFICSFPGHYSMMKGKLIVE